MSVFARTSFALAGALCLSLSNTGCILLLLDEPSPRTDEPPDTFAPPPQAGPSTTTRDEPPTIVSIDVPEWPPIGPTGAVRVAASDDVRLARAEAVFARSSSLSLSGAYETFSLSGADLGEGFGELLLRVTDSNGGWAERRVTGLLVDLTPPTVQTFETIVPARGEHARVDLWVADAWVLGDVVLEFQGKAARHALPEAYPSTLGKQWDGTLVSFDASALPAGRSQATVTARDAAGNVASDAFTLHIDAIAPVVAISSPAPGTVVTERFDVVVTASDVLHGRVWVDVFVGGAPVARTAGSGAVTVDPSELPVGPTSIAVVAFDEAGNESTPVTVDVVIARS